MDKNQVKELLEKFNEGKATPRELRLLEHWFNKQTELNNSDLAVENSAELSQEMWQEVYRATALVRKSNIAGKSNLVDKPNRAKLWSRIAVAASIVFTLGIGIWFFSAQYMDGGHPEFVSGSQYANDVAPGKVGATLTLANGKKIKLQSVAEGQLATEAGVSVTKTADGQLVYELEDPGAQVEKIHTLTTTKGETFDVRLPDGSMVWLNAESSISYTTTLNDKGLRNVKLSGEAYFEVFHNAERPFRVLSKGQVIEVLGTKFNINAYADEPATATTLLQGSVRVTAQDFVSSSSENSGVRLQPGQQAMLTKNGLNITTVNPEDAIAWKNGYFDFKDENMESVMRKLSRWYNIDVEYQGDLSGILFEGEIPRNTSLSQVLKVLEAANVHFTIKGNKLVVKP